MTKQAIVYATLASAARTAAATGYPQEAHAIYRRLSGLIERNSGCDSLEYAACLHDLGDLCVEQKEWQMAEDAYRQALPIYRGHLEVDNPTLALLLRSLSEVLGYRGDKLSARRLDLEAGSILSARLKMGSR